MARPTELWKHRPVWLDAFLWANLAFLVLDVLVAHAINDFAHWAEWIPVYFAGAGTLVLAVSMTQEWTHERDWARTATLAVGWGAIAVGLAGMVWHLEGWFFEATTIRSLVYSAPFVAPLAFAGLGLLIIMNRRVAHGALAWGQWVVFLAWGGFLGNFALSLIDHAQNGFFYWTEWIPVIVSAFAVGHLIVAALRPTDRLFLRIGYGVLAVQALVGILGWILHVAPLWSATGSFMDNVVFGPPVFAPLLFVDLSVLAAIGLWDLDAKFDEQHAVAA